MAHLHQSVATLRVSGEELIPAEITTLLGGVPDIARTRGQQITGRNGVVRISKIGQWHLHSTDTEPENLDAQVSELLGCVDNQASQISAAAMEMNASNRTSSLS